MSTYRSGLHGRDYVSIGKWKSFIKKRSLEKYFYNKHHQVCWAKYHIECWGFSYACWREVNIWNHLSMKGQDILGFPSPASPLRSTLLMNPITPQLYNRFLFLYNPQGSSCLLKKMNELFMKGFFIPLCCKFVSCPSYDFILNFQRKVNEICAVPGNSYQ